MGLSVVTVLLGLGELTDFPWGGNVSWGRVPIRQFWVSHNLRRRDPTPDNQ